MAKIFKTFIFVLFYIEICSATALHSAIKMKPFPEKEVTIETVESYIKSEDNGKIIQGRAFARTFSQLMEVHSSITLDSCSNLKREYDIKNEQCRNGIRNTLKLAECQEGYEAGMKKVSVSNEKITNRKEVLLKNHIGRVLTFEMPNGKYYYAVDERNVWGNSCRSILDMDGYWSPDCMSRDYATRFADHNTLPNITLQFKDKKQATNFEWNNQTIDCSVLGIGKRGNKYEFYCGLLKIR